MIKSNSIILDKIRGKGNILESVRQQKRASDIIHEKNTLMMATTKYTALLVTESDSYVDFVLTIDAIRSFRRKGGL